MEFSLGSINAVPNVRNITFIQQHNLIFTVDRSYLKFYTKGILDGNYLKWDKFQLKLGYKLRIFLIGNFLWNNPPDKGLQRNSSFSTELGILESIS